MNEKWPLTWIVNNSIVKYGVSAEQTNLELLKEAMKAPRNKENVHDNETQ